MNFARRIRRQREKIQKKEARKQNKRRVLLEPLEPRLLLDAEMSFTMSAAAHDLTLRMHDVDDTLLLINEDDSLPEPQVVMSQSLIETLGVLIQGSESPDRLTIDFTGELKHRAMVEVNLGVGQMTILVPRDVGVMLDCSSCTLASVSVSGPFEEEDDVYVNELYGKTVLPLG